MICLRRRKKKKKKASLEPNENSSEHFGPRERKISKNICFPRFWKQASGSRVPAWMANKEGLESAPSTPKSLVQWGALISLPGSVCGQPPDPHDTPGASSLKETGLHFFSLSSFLPQNFFLETHSPIPPGNAQFYNCTAKDYDRPMVYRRPKFHLANVKLVTKSRSSQVKGPLQKCLAFIWTQTCMCTRATEN